MKLQLRVTEIQPWESKYKVHFVIEDLSRRWFKVRKEDYIIADKLDAFTEGRLKDELKNFAPSPQPEDAKKLIGKIYTLNILEKPPVNVELTSGVSVGPTTQI